MLLIALLAVRPLLGAAAPALWALTEGGVAIKADISLTYSMGRPSSWEVSPSLPTQPGGSLTETTSTEGPVYPRRMRSPCLSEATFSIGWSLSSVLLVLLTGVRRSRSPDRWIEAC